MADPAFPSGIRPYRPGDEDAILASSLDSLGAGELDGVTRHDLEDSIRRLPGDPAMCAVAEEDGRVVGWVIPQHDDLTVDRAHRRRGHGTRLAVAGRAIASRRGLPFLRLWVPRRPGPEAFARSIGMIYHSSLWLMRLPAAVPADAPVFAPDIVVRPFESGIDEPAYVSLVNAAFADHVTPLAYSLDQVRHVHGLPGFVPSSILLAAPASDPGRLIGFCRIDRYRDDAGRTVGDVRTLGVVPAYRNRGLGRELLRWGVSELRARGAAEVFLQVEGANDRALGLYRRAGFAAAVEWPHWVLPTRGADVAR